MSINLVKLVWTMGSTSIMFYFRKALRMCISQYLVSSIFALIALCLILFLSRWQTTISNLFIQMSTAYIVAYVFFVFTNINQAIKTLIPLENVIQTILNYHTRAIHYLMDANLTKETLDQLKSQDSLYKKIEKIKFSRQVNCATMCRESGTLRYLNALEALEQQRKSIKTSAHKILQLNYHIPYELQKILLNIIDCDSFGFMYMISVEQLDSPDDRGRLRRDFCKDFIKHHQVMCDLSQFFKNYLCKDFTFVNPNFPQGKPG